MTTREEFRQAVKDEYLRRLGASVFDLAADVAERLGMTSEHPGPWEPGQDVTSRLAAGEQAPEGTILRDEWGYLYRIEADGKGTLWEWPGWSGTLSSWEWRHWRGYVPVTVATPEQLTAAGISTGSGQ